MSNLESLAYPHPDKNIRPLVVEYIQVSRFYSYFSNLFRVVAESSVINRTLWEHNIRRPRHSVVSTSRWEWWRKSPFFIRWSGGQTPKCECLALYESYTHTHIEFILMNRYMKNEQQLLPCWFLSNHSWKSSMLFLLPLFMTTCLYQDLKT